MSARLFTSPWASFAGETGVDLYASRSPQIRGVVHPRLTGALPDRLTWNGIRPVPASPSSRPGRGHWDLPFPISGEQASAVVSEGLRSTVVQIRGLRARTAGSAREAEPREQWLVWQLQRYAELADLGGKGDLGTSLEGKLPWGTRRTWQSIQEYWRQGGEEAAELALVVRLAQDSGLLHALRSVERGPRRMLFRQHEKVKLSRIQEMDAGTLRAYSQAPGRNAAQKAGAKQELLAVVRQDTVDLVENRLLLWIADRMRSMAEVYCVRNLRFKQSARFQGVRQLHSICRQIVESPRLEGVSALQHHLAAPTYCLQSERRYRQVWRAYGLIRRQERLEDDAWQWQTRFWGTSARLIVGSMLLGLQGWSEPRASTPYFRDEGICGQWTQGPSAPGPLDTPYGTCHVLDPGAIENLGPRPSDCLPEEAMESGADWILVWPARQRILLLWSAVANGTSSTAPEELGLEVLSRRLIGLSRSSAWTWSGILFVAEPDQVGKDYWYLEEGQGVVVVRVPSDVHLRWDDIQAGLQVAVEELHHG